MTDASLSITAPSTMRSPSATVPSSGGLPSHSPPAAFSLAPITATPATSTEVITARTKRSTPPISAPVSTTPPGDVTWSGTTILFSARRASAIFRFHPDEVASTLALSKRTSAPITASARITAPFAWREASDIPPVTLIPGAETANPPLSLPSISAPSRLSQPVMSAPERTRAPTMTASANVAPVAILI